LKALKEEIYHDAPKWAVRDLGNGYPISLHLSVEEATKELFRLGVNHHYITKEPILEEKDILKKVMEEG
jgi:hypothetical protein